VSFSDGITVQVVDVDPLVTNVEQDVVLLWEQVEHELLLVVHELVPVLQVEHELLLVVHELVPVLQVEHGFEDVLVLLEQRVHDV